MDSNTETDIFSIVSTPNATPTTEVGNQPVSHSLPESLNKRWAEVQSELGSEIESCPLSGIVSPNILIRDEILEYPTQTPFVLFQNESENSLDSRVEMLSDSQNVEELQKIPNENMCEQPSEPHRSFDMNPTSSTPPMREGQELFNIDLENVCQ